VSSPLAARSDSPGRRALGRPRAAARFQDLGTPGFAVIVTALVAGAILGYWNTLRLVENDRRVAHTHTTIGQAGELLSTLKDAETGQRGYLLVGDESYLQPYQDALRREQGLVRTLRELSSDDPEQRARVEAMVPLIDQRIDELTRTISLARSGDRAAALEFVRGGTGRATMDKIRVAVAAIQRTEEAHLVERSRESEESARAAMTSILIAGLLGVGLVILVFSHNQRAVRLRKRDAETIEQQRNQLRVTLASIDDAVITADTAGRVTSLNAVAEALTGWGEAEAKGRPLDVVYNVVNSAMSGRRHRHGAAANLDGGVVLISRDGTNRPIDDSASPIRDSDGRALGVVLAFRDIGARRAAERAVHESRAELEEELQDMNRLQSVSAELIGEKNVEALYSRIVDAAVGIMRSDFGSMQMYQVCSGSGSLKLLAFRGFAPESARFWGTVYPDSACVCGMALKERVRQVIPDVEANEVLAGTEHLVSYRRNGIRATQSTPLISRSGRIVGMISTHWRNVHRPPARRLLLLDILARQASDLLERRRAEQEILHAQESLKVSAANDAFRLKLADTLRSLSDPAEIQAAGARALAQYLKCERGTYAEVDPSGKDFVEVDFSPAPGSGRGYEEYGKARDLAGTVVTKSGRYDGRIIFDLDEALDCELLQGMNGHTEYIIPFRDIARIRTEGPHRSVVELRMGLKVELGDGQDVSRKNDGVLVFDGGAKPRYVGWRDVQELVFR
jgi:PAS domain S-box-containing protein